MEYDTHLIQILNIETGNKKRLTPYEIDTVCERVAATKYAKENSYTKDIILIHLRKLWDIYKNW